MPDDANPPQYDGLLVCPVVLTLGYIFNFIDRQVMTILLEPIKAEFSATDTQMGLPRSGLCVFRDAGCPASGGSLVREMCW